MGFECFLWRNLADHFSGGANYNPPRTLPATLVVAGLCGFLICRGSLDVALAAVLAGGVLGRAAHYGGGRNAVSTRASPGTKNAIGGGAGNRGSCVEATSTETPSRPVDSRHARPRAREPASGKRDNEEVPALTFVDARETVLRTVRLGRTLPPIEDIPLAEASGRVLARDAEADRDLPSLARSVRDGYAVRSVDLPGQLNLVGEVRAGERFAGQVAAGQAVQIMTGAPIPSGADTVVMLEHAQSDGARVTIDHAAEARQFVNPQGCEAAAHQVVLRTGKRLDYADIALLAAIGRARVQVYRRPVVAIVATGDEIVEIDELPEEFQIRNSNAWSLASQVVRAGGVPHVLPVARDTKEHTREIIGRGLAADLLLLSGGVSAGKYDVVEPVLADFGAEFYFDRVLIQPGQPLVFGHVAGKYFFGLPGNPSATMVTFEVFARAALELLAGQQETPLYLPLSRLAREFRHRPGLTRFLPARLSADGSEVTPVNWHGSGDIPAMTLANAYLVADPDRPVYAPGDLIRILLK